MTHLTFEQLCDLTDGVLDGAAEAAARDHLQACDECSAQHAEIVSLATATAALPLEIAPPDDLWGDIRASIAPERARPRAFAWGMPQLAAAGILVAVASSAITMIAMRERTAQPASVVAATTAAVQPAPDVVELPTRLASDEMRYTRNVDALQRVLAERRDSLAPSTVATVERSLAIADAAIAEARDALARDPGNRALIQLFASNYERKIDLLRRATELTPRT